MDGLDTFDAVAMITSGGDDHNGKHGQCALICVERDDHGYVADGVDRHRTGKTRLNLSITFSSVLPGKDRDLHERHLAGETEAVHRCPQEHADPDLIQARTPDFRD